MSEKEEVEEVMAVEATAKKPSVARSSKGKRTRQVRDLETATPLSKRTPILSLSLGSAASSPWTMGNPGTASRIGTREVEKWAMTLSEEGMVWRSTFLDESDSFAVGEGFRFRCSTVYDVGVDASRMSCTMGFKSGKRSFVTHDFCYDLQPTMSFFSSGTLEGKLSLIKLGEFFEDDDAQLFSETVFDMSQPLGLFDASAQARCRISSPRSAPLRLLVEFLPPVALSAKPIVSIDFRPFLSGLDVKRKVPLCSVHGLGRTLERFGTWCPSPDIAEGVVGGALATSSTPILLNGTQDSRDKANGDSGRAAHLGRLQFKCRNQKERARRQPGRLDLRFYSPFTPEIGLPFCQSIERAKDDESVDEEDRADDLDAYEDSEDVLIGSLPATSTSLSFQEVLGVMPARHISSHMFQTDRGVGRLHCRLTVRLAPLRPVIEIMDHNGASAVRVPLYRCLQDDSETEGSHSGLSSSGAPPLRTMSAPEATHLQQHMHELELEQQKLKGHRLSLGLQESRQILESPDCRERSSSDSAATTAVEAKKRGLAQSPPPPPRPSAVRGKDLFDLTAGGSDLSDLEPDLEASAEESDCDRPL